MIKITQHFIISLGESNLISCFTGETGCKSGSVGRQKYKHKVQILMLKTSKSAIKDAKL